MANGWGGKRAGSGPKRVGVTRVRDAAVKADTEARQSIDLTATTQVAQVTKGGKFNDAFVNYPHRLGIGANNILSSSSASFNPLTRIRTLLEWMYRGQFVCKNAVDVIPEDMTRQGVIIKGPMKPKDIRRMETEAIALNLWGNVRSTLKWSRLYGGCLGFMVVAGQNPETPLKIETVGKGQFKGILPLDRWMVDPTLSHLVTDFNSTAIGKPMFYNITADAPALPRMKIHNSRVIRLVGNELPYWQAIQENLWGLSVLETIHDRINAFDIGSSGAAQLIDKSFIRTYKIKGLKELIGSNTMAYEGIRALLEVMRSQQGIEGVTLMDLDDEYQGHEHGAFSGLADILQEFRQQLSGALGIPQTKLFGTSPAGMNATGESDMRNYYDMIKARQISDLLHPMTLVYQMLAQSLGIKWDEENCIEFRPLWQPTETEKAEIAKSITETVLAAEEKGTISQKTALMELKQQSDLSGVWTNISEEDIEAAEEEPVPAAQAMAEMGSEMGFSAPKPAGFGPKKPPMGGKPGAKAPAAKPTMKAKPKPVKKPTKDAAIGTTHYEVHGLPICVETAKGEVRYSRKGDWKATMAADYGFIVNTGSAEGVDEGMDCFVGPDRSETTIYVIDQKDLSTGFFDEHKCMLCFSSPERALSAYVSSYSDLQGVDRVMGVHTVPIEDFKAWLATGHMRKPYKKPE